MILPNSTMHLLSNELERMANGTIGEYKSVSANRKPYIMMNGESILKNYQEKLEAHERKKLR